MIKFCLFLSSSFTCHCSANSLPPCVLPFRSVCLCSPCLCYFRVMSNFSVFLLPVFCTKYVDVLCYFFLCFPHILSMYLCSFCLCSARKMSMFCVPSSCVLPFMMSIVSVFLLPVFCLLCCLCLCVPFACVLHVMCRCSLFLPFTFCLYDVYVSVFLLPVFCPYYVYVSVFLLSKFCPFYIDFYRCSFCVLFV